MDFQAYFVCVLYEIGRDPEVYRGLWFQEVDGDGVWKYPEIVLIEQGVDGHLDLDILRKNVYFTGLVVGERYLSIQRMDGVYDPHDLMGVGKEFDLALGSYSSILQGRQVPFKPPGKHFRALVVIFIQRPFG